MDVVAAADGLAVDEDLRDGAAAPGRFDQPGALLVVVADVDFFEGDPAAGEKRLARRLAKGATAARFLDESAAWALTEGRERLHFPRKKRTWC